MNSMQPDANSQVTLRDAMPDDVPALAALGRKTFSDKFAHLYRPQDLADYLEDCHSHTAYRAYLADPENLIRVAEAEDRSLAAYLLCSPLTLPAGDPKPGAVELKRVYVDASLQGRGLGSRFIDEALAWARAKGAPEMYLSVYSGNVEAQRLYARRGWEKVGEFLFPVGAHRDLEYLMRLSL